MSNINLIPYGLLPQGNFGVNIDPSNGEPLASAIEIQNTLPPVSDPDNFRGRIVFSITDQQLFIFKDTPTARWDPLEGTMVEISTTNGTPPSTPTPPAGKLIWDLATNTLYLWTGASWVIVGGNIGTRVVHDRYTGDGITSSFPLSVSSAVSDEYVFVNIDGVSQISGVDYVVVGTTVFFTVAPANGTNISIKTFETTSVTPNAESVRASYVANTGDTTFSVGATGVNDNGLMVFVNGNLQQYGIDYQHITQDTSVVSLVKINTTTARVTTSYPHGIPVGANVELGGFQESVYNSVFTVTSVPSSSTFEISVQASDPPSGTPNPTAWFWPKFIPDQIIFGNPLNNGDRVDIHAFRNVLVNPIGMGEVNTLQSIGTGVPLPGPKVGSTLQVKSLVQGSGINLIDTGMEVIVETATTQSFEDRVSFNGSSYTLTGPESYVGVRNTSNTVTVDLTPITPIPTNSGRRVTIKDESGGASASTPINILTGASTIDGAPSPYTITTPYGFVTLVFDGSDWFVTARG